MLGIFVLLWRVEQGDPGRTGRVRFSYPSTPPTVVWADTLKLIGAPVLGDTSVYVVDSSVLYKYNALSGVVVCFNDGSAGGGGIDRRSPVVSGDGSTVAFSKYYRSDWHGIVYGVNPTDCSRRWTYVLTHSGSWVGSWMDEYNGILTVPDYSNPNGFITALNVSSGSLIWETEVTDVGGDEDFLWTTIDSVRGKVFVGGGNREVRVHALDLYSGSYLWVRNVGEHSLMIGLVDPQTGNVYHPTYTTLKSYDTNGNLLWNVSGNFEYPFAFMALSPSGDTLYAPFSDGYVRAISTSDGSVLWSFNAGGRAIVATDASNNVLVAYKGRVSLLSPSGIPIWSVLVDGSEPDPVGIALARWSVSPWIYVTFTNETIYALTYPYGNDTTLGVREHPTGRLRIKTRGRWVGIYGHGMVSLYRIDGTLIDRIEVKGQYGINLPTGVYILKGRDITEAIVVR